MPPDPLANLCLRHSAHTFGDRILSWGGQGKWALWQFFGRQSDSSLIFGRIIDPRPGLRALSIDPFVPCVIHWYTIYLSLHIHIVLLRPHEERCRKTICFAMPQQIYKVVSLVPKILKNCYCELKLYIIPIEEKEIFQNTRPLVASRLVVISYHVQPATTISLDTYIIVSR